MKLMSGWKSRMVVQPMASERKDRHSLRGFRRASILDAEATITGDNTDQPQRKAE